MGITPMFGSEITIKSEVDLKIALIPISEGKCSSPVHGEIMNDHHVLNGSLSTDLISKMISKINFNCLYKENGN